MESVGDFRHGLLARTFRRFAVLVLVCFPDGVAAQGHTTGEPAIVTRKPEPRVTLSLEDPSPIIGVAGETLLRIEVLDAPTTPMPIPRVLCSVGQVEDLSREGDTIFTARYILPAGRFPQPSILVAEFAIPSGSLRGLLISRLRAATTVMAHSDPGTQMTVRVGDKEFGPQTAPANGWVRMPVVVPPGVDFAIARSENKHGKATESVRELRVPYSRQVLLVAPERLAAGQIGEAVVYAVEPSGRPAPSAQLTLQSVPKLNLQPLGGRIPGEARFVFQAPKVLSDKAIDLQAMLGGQTTTFVKSRVALVPARPSGVTLDAESDHLDTEPGKELRVFLGAEDGYGNVVDAGKASVLVDGIPTAVRSSETGTPMVIVKTPRHSQHQRTVDVEAVLDGRYATLDLPIGWPSDPKTDSYERALRPRATVLPKVGTLWNLGKANGLTLFIEGMRHRQRTLPGFGLGLSAGLVLTWFNAQNSQGVSESTIGSLPLLAILSHRFAFDRWIVGGTVGAGFCLSIASVAGFKNYRTTGYSFGTAGSASIEAGRLLTTGHLVASLRYLFLYLDKFSTGDQIMNNAGGLVAEVGYRQTY